MSNFRFVIAAVIAPLSAPITIIFLQLIVWGNLSLYNDPDISLVMWMYTAASYVGLLVAVFPIVYVLRNLHRVSLGALVVAGAISGMVVYGFFLSLLGLALDFPAHIGLPDVIASAILGVMLGAVFGLIAGVNNLREKGIAE